MKKKKKENLRTDLVAMTSRPPRRKNSQQGGQTGAGDFCFEEEGGCVGVGVGCV